jgi:hypothetical protein
MYRIKQSRALQVEQTVTVVSNGSQMSVRNEIAMHVRQREKFARQLAVPFRWRRQVSLVGFALREGERFANVVKTCYSRFAKRD